MPRPLLPLRAVFERHVQRTPGCWLWTGPVSRKYGWGLLRQAPAHRVAYRLEHGDLPRYQMVRQVCGNRLCVRPDHLLVLDDVSANIEPEPNSGCWLWAGRVNAQGYGMVRAGGRRVRAPRAAYEKALGPIPVGLEICHRCDTPLCVNPDHLFAGTHKENMRDMARKGRATMHFLNSEVCRNGHPRTVENTATVRLPDGRSWHRCKVCGRAKTTIYNRRRRGKCA